MRRGLAEAADHLKGQDADLVRVLLNARSPGEANLALVLLRRTVPDREIVFFTNLREMLSEIPATPFSAGAEIEILERVLGYEGSGGSYRRAFYCEGGVFGLEFFGDANRVDRIEVVTVEGHMALTSVANEIMDPRVVELMLHYEDLGDMLIDALIVLGVSFSPRFYLSVTDYVMENGGAPVADLEGLF